MAEVVVQSNVASFSQKVYAEVVLTDEAMSVVVLNVPLTTVFVPYLVIRNV